MKSARRCNKKNSLKKALGLFIISVLIATSTLILTRADKQTATAVEDFASSPVSVCAMEIIGLKTCLPGAKMQLLDEDGSIIEELTTTEEEYTLTSRLVIGKTYTIRETKAPNEIDYLSGNPYSYSDIADFTLARDVDFIISKSETGEETIRWSYWRGIIGADSKRYITSDSWKINVYSYRSRTLEFGNEILGSAADPNEYFEFILNIPNGIPRQTMHVDLSGADSERNPSEVIVGDDGRLNASFWLKGGQSITVDGFPLFMSGYYSLHENNAQLNANGYITHIKANETISQLESDWLIVSGISLISQIEEGSNSLDSMNSRSVLSATLASAQVTTDAFDVMSQRLDEELFAIENPIVNPGSGGANILETLGMALEKGNAPFSLNDTLTDGVTTERSASKLGNIPGDLSGMLVFENAVYGDGKALFINRRDGVMIEKVDESNNYLAGGKMQILDSEGNAVLDFTTTEDATFIVTLAPGEYVLHEVKAPDGYEVADDISFVVEDLDTLKVDGRIVDSVVMVDRASPENNPNTTSSSPSAYIIIIGSFITVLGLWIYKARRRN